MNRIERFVYWLYDDGGRLIYVGCTRNLVARVSHHQRMQWWGSQIASVKSRGYYSVSAARRREREAIRDESPRWNRMGRWGSHAHWSDDEWSDYITAIKRGGRITPAVQKHLDNVLRMNSIRLTDQVAS